MVWRTEKQEGASLALIFLSSRCTDAEVRVPGFPSQTIYGINEAIGRSEMSRIKINDLSKPQRIGRKKMKGISGGLYTPTSESSGWEGGAEPLNPGSTGTRHFFCSERGVIRFSTKDAEAKGD